MYPIQIHIKGSTNPAALWFENEDAYKGMLEHLSQQKERGAPIRVEDEFNHQFFMEDTSSISHFFALATEKASEVQRLMNEQNMQQQLALQKVQVKLQKEFDTFAAKHQSRIVPARA